MCCFNFHSALKPPLFQSSLFLTVLIWSMRSHFISSCRPSVLLLTCLVFLIRYVDPISLLYATSLLSMEPWARIKIGITFIFRLRHRPIQLVVFVLVGLSSFLLHRRQVLLGVEVSSVARPGLSFQLVWRCHQFLSGFLVNDHLSECHVSMQPAIMIWLFYMPSPTSWCRRSLCGH